jgi:MFS family permease
VLASVIFLNFTAGGATMPFFSLYATSLGASLGQIAFVVGVQSAVAMVAGLVWGRVADRVGRRKPFIVGAVAAMALTSLAIARVPSWPWLVPLHVALGVAQGAQQVSSLALMGDILEGHPRRGRLVSGYRMSGSLAFSVAIVTSGWIAENVGLRGSFLLASGVYALSFLVALFITEPGRLASTARSVGFVRLMRGPLRPLLILALSFGVPFSAVFSVWPIWVADVLGYGRATFSQLWGIAAFVEVPCILVAGMLVDRVGRRPTFVAGLTGFAVVYLLYVLEPPLPGLVGAQVLRGIAFAAYTATALTMAIDLAPAEERGRAAGLFTSAQGLAQIAGSWVGGPLAAALGFRALFALASAAVLCGAAYSYLVLGRRAAAAGAPAAETIGSPVAPRAVASRRPGPRPDEGVKTR